jgi:phosphoribosylformimino-5-aminoimidazole carboxamide ribotide isomerase
LTPSSRPIDVARAYRDHLGLTELYVADLDAISGAAPAASAYGELQADGFRLWVDAGVRDERAAVCLAEAGVESVVIGLETVSSPESLALAVHRLGKRIVFSLDLRDGIPLGDLGGWEGRDALSIARQAVELGVSRVLVLDLARVGVASGPGAAGLCRQLAASYPHLEVGAGGGVRDRYDLKRLQDDGVQAVLVASAVHDARLRRGDLAGL